MLLAAVTIIALVAGGCGGGKTASGSGGTLTIANVTDIVQLDPIDIGDAPSSFVAGQIYDSLVKRDKDGNLIPGLATKWTVSPDGLTWHFELRKNVKFTDGEPFNANVVKWHIDRIQAKDSVPRFKAQFSVIKEVKVVDQYNVDFVLTQPNGAFIEYTLMTNAGMIPSPKAYKEKGKNFAFEPVGTGPYKFVKWTPGQKVELVRNDQYWGGKPKLDGIVFRNIPEAATQIIELETGGVNYISKLTQEDIARLSKNPKLQVYNVGAYNVRYLSMNVKDPIIGDVKVREAIAHALDFKSIVDRMLKGLVSPGDAIVPNTSWAHPAKVQGWDYSLDKAKALLDEAGWKVGADGIRTKDGKKLEITIHSPNGRYIMDKEICEVVQQELSKIGIKVNVKVLEWGAFLADVQGKKYQMAFLGWAQSSPEPSLFLDALVMTGGRGNYTSYGNKDVDALLKQAIAASDQAKRKDLYGQAMALMDKDIPYIYIYNENKVVAMAANIQGYVHSPAMNDFTTLWIKK